MGRLSGLNNKDDVRSVSLADEEVKDEPQDIVVDSDEDLAVEVPHDETDFGNDIAGRLAQRKSRAVEVGDDKASEMLAAGTTNAMGIIYKEVNKELGMYIDHIYARNGVDEETRWDMDREIYDYFMRNPEYIPELEYFTNDPKKVKPSELETRMRTSQARKTIDALLRANNREKFYSRWLWLYNYSVANNDRSARQWSDEFIYAILNNGLMDIDAFLWLVVKKNVYRENGVIELPDWLTALVWKMLKRKHS